MQQQDTRNRKGNEKRKWRETRAEERNTKTAKATSGGRGWGRMVSKDTRESEPPAEDRQTAEEYKPSKKRSGRGERKGEAERNEKRMTDRKNIETSKERKKREAERTKNETTEL